MTTTNLRITMKIMKISMQVRKKSSWRSRIQIDLILYYQQIIWRLSIMAIIVSMKMVKMKISHSLKMRMTFKSRMKMMRENKNRNGTLMKMIQRSKMQSYLKNMLKCKELTCRRLWEVCKMRRMTSKWYLWMKKEESSIHRQ